MERTKFLSNIEKARLFNKAYKGDESAINILVDEFRRLENRVKSLEYGIGLLLDHAENINPNPSKQD